MSIENYALAWDIDFAVNRQLEIHELKKMKANAILTAVEVSKIFGDGKDSEGGSGDDGEVQVC